MQPGPDILVRKGADERKATLWTWDESKDLALLNVDKGGLTWLDWADTKELRLVIGCSPSRGWVPQAEPSLRGILRTSPRRASNTTPPSYGISRWTDHRFQRESVRSDPATTRRWASPPTVCTSVFRLMPHAKRCSRALAVGSPGRASRRSLARKLGSASRGRRSSRSDGHREGCDRPSSTERLECVRELLHEPIAARQGGAEDPFVGNEGPGIVRVGPRALDGLGEKRVG